MRFLRIVLAGLIGVAAMIATMLAAAVVILTGLFALVVQFFRRQPGAAPGPARSPDLRKDGAIDVVATHVPDKPSKP